MSSSPARTSLTRREALALGASAGVTASVGVSGSALAAAAGGAFGAPLGAEFLRRSTYAELVGEQFGAGRHVLTLVGVGDVGGAQTDRRLVGHESAFELEFTGAADVLPSAIHELYHPHVGPFALFIGPVGAVRGLEQSYGVTVDRSVPIAGAPRPAAPAPPAVDEPEREPSARDAEVLAAREQAAIAPLVVRRRRARRARRKLVDTHGRRIRFKAKQRAASRKRARNAATGWLRRHGR